MKLNGLVGKGTGKLGSSVFAVSGGEQIVRQYNPNVSNPQTTAQVKQRARFKLLSQIAAALASILAYTRDGLKSARNQFVMKNFYLTSCPEDTAEVTLAELQLTPGSAALPALNVARASANSISAGFSADYSASYDRVVYACVEKTENDKLSVYSVKTQEKGQDGHFTATINAPSTACLVYAYGVKFNSASAKTKFDNYIATAGETEAFLGTDVKTLMANATLSATSGFEIDEQA